MWILGFAILGSVGAVAGAGTLLLFPKRTRETVVPYLISYATGTLLAAALLGLLHHAIEASSAKAILATTVAGLFVFFLLERTVIWRHCHAVGPCEIHRTAGYLILVGDALHNFVDGIVIAAAFLSSVPLGIATGLAVIAHELPQEVSDFAILLDSGFESAQAFQWNVISSAATLPGALIGYGLLSQVEQVVPHLLGLAAASFLYIGLADLIPGLQGRIGPEIGVRQALVMLAGVATIVMLQVHRQ